MLDLVAEEPEVVARLQVVAGRRLAVALAAAGEEVVADVDDPRDCREQRGREEDRRGERYKACAAAISSSKFGTSESS